MKFRDLINMPIGIRYYLDQLDLQSGYSRRILLGMEILTDRQDIERSYLVLKHIYEKLILKLDKSQLSTLQFKLQQLRDISTTILRLEEDVVLDDIELFEIKHLAMLAEEVSQLLRINEVDQLIIPEMVPVIDILDPDKTRIASFYIYDSYSEQLKQLRTEYKAERNSDIAEKLMDAIRDMESEIRDQLTLRLEKYTDTMREALYSLGNLDILIGKSLMIKNHKMIIPETSRDRSCNYIGMYHPQVASALKEKGREFQGIDIYIDDILVIIGANMGGKSVVLKSLALCQHLFQFGFPIPAVNASISPKRQIFFIIGDHQNELEGLSSFAAEMKAIDNVILESVENKDIVAFIDEPARTTNPVEGTALVSSLLKVLKKRDIELVVTTHYNIEDDGFRRLKVRGLIDGKMDYSLIEAKNGEVPREALNIAESLGISEEWIEEAKRELNYF